MLLLPSYRLFGVSLFSFPLRHGENTIRAILQAAGFYKWGSYLNSLTQSWCQSSQLFTGDITRDAFWSIAKTSTMHRLSFLVQHTSENSHSILTSPHQAVSSRKYMTELHGNFYFWPWNRLDLGSPWTKTEQTFVGTTIIFLIRFSNPYCKPAANNEKKKKDGVGGMRSDSSSRQTWLNNHCLINQDLTVPPIVISQDVNKLLLSLYFLESTWNIPKE